MLSIGGTYMRKIMPSTKRRILITGSVLTSNLNSKKIYEDLVSICSLNENYEIYSPLDTMVFQGTDEEKYVRAMKILRNARVIIAEMSNVSTGQGMELQEAVHFNIPILVIAKKDSKISGLVKGCPMVKEILYYEKIDAIKEKIVDFLQKEFTCE